MNAAQKALLTRLRELVEETPKSDALNAGKRALHITRFAQAVERRAEDGNALVKYARAKVHEAPTGGYTSLIEANRPDLTLRQSSRTPTRSGQTSSPKLIGPPHKAALAT